MGIGPARPRGALGPHAPGGYRMTPSPPQRTHTRKIYHISHTSHIISHASYIINTAPPTSHHRPSISPLPPLIISHTPPAAHVFICWVPGWVPLHHTRSCWLSPGQATAVAVAVAAALLVSDTWQPGGSHQSSLAVAALQAVASHAWEQ